MPGVRYRAEAVEGLVAPEVEGLRARVEVAEVAEVAPEVEGAGLVAGLVAGGYAARPGRGLMGLGSKLDS